MLRAVFETTSTQINVTLEPALDERIVIIGVEMGRVLRQILTSCWDLASLRKVLRFGPTNQRGRTKAAREVCA